MAAGADAVLAATVFHYGTLRIGEVKAALAAGRRAACAVRGAESGLRRQGMSRSGWHVAWLPYADAAEADERLGGIPDGIAVDCYRADGDPMPDSIAEVEFYVLPYMKGAEVLERSGRDEQPAGDPDAHRGRGELPAARARRRDPVQRRRACTTPAPPSWRWP